MHMISAQKILHKNHTSPTMPIFAMSANAYDEDVKACLASGMNAHIAKPFDPNDLLKLLYEQINELKA